MAATVDGGAGRRDSSRRPALRRWRALLLLAGVIALGVAAGRWVAEPVRVTSQSMLPTLRAGDEIVVEKVSPRLGRLDRGDLITFRSPADGALMVKRLVALPGDVVEFRDAVLYVNDRPVAEPYVDLSRIDGLYFGPETVPPDRVFVLGDSRAGSVDSRTYGAVPIADVVGRVVFRIWPLGGATWLG